MFASSFLFLFFAVGVFVLVKAGDGFVKRVPVNRRAPFLVYADDILESRRTLQRIFRVRGVAAKLGAVHGVQRP